MPHESSQREGRFASKLEGILHSEPGRNDSGVPSQVPTPNHDCPEVSSAQGLIAHGQMDLQPGCKPGCDDSLDGRRALLLTIAHVGSTSLRVLADPVTNQLPIGGGLRSLIK